MSRNIHGTVLQRRNYTEDLQRLFADLSGDHNPLHVDPVAARRTLVGARAVHGINHALGALEALLAWFAKHGQDRSIAGFKAQFLKPVQVGDVVVLHLTKLTDQGGLVSGRIGGEVVFRSSVRFGPISAAVHDGLPRLAPERVAELPFSALEGKTGLLQLGLDDDLARKLFPLVAEKLGMTRLAATLALSRLVGMHCPGLHSLFAEAEVGYGGANRSANLHYSVTEAEERYNRIVMAIDGALDGQLIAFFRPPPQPQPGMAEVMQVVKAGQFAESVALVVGGSRGLGEITAKIIAAGGGLAIITYHQGAAEAERVAQAIRDHGGRCEALRLNVQNSRQAIRDLGRRYKNLRSLYYYATPKIPGRQRGFFSHDMLRQFNEIYVTAFGRLIDGVAENSPSHLRVFYPSSTFVTDGMEKMEEYIMAKRLAEEMCAFYNQNSKKMKIIVERLPRLKTDQTSSVIPVLTQDTLEVMLPLVARMEDFTADG